MTRKIDGDALIKSLEDLYQKAGWGEREVHFSLADMKANVSFQPEAADDQKIIVRVNRIVSKYDLDKFAEELKGKYPNIIVLPPEVDLMYPSQNWIPIWVMPPEYRTECLFYTKSGGYIVGYREDAFGQDIYETGAFASGSFTPLAWMPLPEPYRRPE